MMKNYVRQCLLSVALTAAVPAMAIDFPDVTQTLTDGGTYILISRSNPTQFWSRTSWDGAYYLLPYGDQYKDAAFKAVKNENGTWSFAIENEEKDEDGNVIDTYSTYVGIPFGTDNLNGNLYEQAEWTVEETDVTGFYKLKAGEGQENDATIGGYLHLNAGNQYAVISEAIGGGGWFPDYFGGVQKDEDGEPVYDDAGFVIPLDDISQYWAFASVDTDFEPYNLKIQLYAALQDVEQNYLPMEGYGAGFQKAIDQALPYYQKADFTADDLAAAKAIIDNSLALYKSILSAIELLGGSSDAGLKQAISDATEAFNSGDNLTAAGEALAAAMKAFAEAGGDLTLMGTNMSFEDLSAQDGNMTSGVAAPPVGWNVYINGQQVTTADEVKKAGVANWHGVNDDAEGEPMDGSYAFGLWTSGVPQYEISQTISGLDNGTYTVSAGVMVGANGSGSRRTTQRLFGNLNATYFASEFDYDATQLDQSEVYGFADLIEPTTDRELQEMSVRAFVYDGTLTFGLRTDGNIKAALRDASNSAGGDGWFKVDNFRINKEGYVQDDALAVYQHYYDIVKTISGEQIQKSIATKIADVTSATIGAGSSEQEIIDAILKLKEAYPEALASMQLYVRLQEAINKAYTALVEYQLYAGADEYGDLVMDAEDMYEAAEAGEEEIEAMIKQLEEGLEALKASGVAMGDITYMLKNPSFEDLSAQNDSPSDGAQNAPYGWTLYVDGEEAQTVSGGWCAINHGDNISVELEDGSIIDHQYTDGEYLWGIWNSNIPEVELSQTLTGMPAGTYTVQADVMVQYNWAGDCTTTQRIFGNNSVQMWGSQGAYSEMNLPEDAKNADELTYANYICAPNQPGMDNSDLLHPMSVTFGVGEDGVLKVGFRTNGINIDGAKWGQDGGLNGQGWFKVDNFRLSYDSEEMPAAIKGVTAGNGQKASVAYYSLDGRQQNAPQRGLNIVKTANGKTVKVIVK